jgi:hypothetical protein
MIQILSTLANLEDKFDSLAIGQGGFLTLEGPAKSKTACPSPQSSEGFPPLNPALGRDFPSKLHHSYQHLTAPHKVVLWPSIFTHLINSGTQTASDLQYVLREGTAWFIRQGMEKHPLSLPTDQQLPCFRLDDPLSETGHSKRYTFPTLTVQQAQEYADAYFNAFNVISPILDYESTKGTIARLSREGYADSDPHSVIALLVYALGNLAIEGASGIPISNQSGTPSGFRGGTVERPPGLEIFNEARRRLGFVMGLCTLENVQIMLLKATFYEANSRHLDFWRCTMAASMAIQVVVRCQHINWQSPSGDMIKRAYWVCVLSEDLYHLDLDLPRTGINKLEDLHGYPRGFEGQSYFQYHFLAMIPLTRITGRVNVVIHQCTYCSSFPFNATVDPDHSHIRPSRKPRSLWRPSCHRCSRIGPPARLLALRSSFSPPVARRRHA